MQANIDRGHRFAQSTASHRSRSSSTFRDIPARNPTSRLLFSALAVAAGRTCIDNSRRDGTGGGEGWLVIGYWTWRLGREVRNRWRVRKGKRKETRAHSHELSAVSVQRVTSSLTSSDPSHWSRPLRYNPSPLVSLCELVDQYGEVSCGDC